LLSQFIGIIIDQTRLLIELFNRGIPLLSASRKPSWLSDYYFWCWRFRLTQRRWVNRCAITRFRHMNI